MDQKAIHKYGFRTGYQEGLEEGMKQKQIEIARTLIQMNLPIKQIEQITNLSEKEIKKLY